MATHDNGSTLRLSATSVADCGPHRTSSRSVSWNSTGFYLAVACSDRSARLLTVDGGGGSSGSTAGDSGGGTASSSAQQQQAREVLVISGGHTAPVTKVRFHPSEPTTLCTAAMDQTVRLWDCRQATQRAMGCIDITSGKKVTSVEWCCNPPPVSATTRGISGGVSQNSHLLAVTEDNSKIYIYDSRQLGGSSSSATGSRSNAAALHVVDLSPRRVESAMFGPHSDDFLLAATTRRENDMGHLSVWNWKQHMATLTAKQSRNASSSSSQSPSAMMHYPGHTGRISTMAISRNGKRMAAGGSDALVSLWDVDTMICTHTITRPTKYVCSVAFSHDGRFLATATEDVELDVANAATGEKVGAVNLATATPGGGSSNHMPRRGGGGADEVAWHPKAYVLACARFDRPSMPPAPVTIVQFAASTVSAPQ